MGRLDNSGDDGDVICSGDVGDIGDVGGAGGRCKGAIGARARLRV